MTKEEVEQAFSGVSPYYAYKQGIQDGIAYNEESFRREAAKDLLAAIMVQNGCDFFTESNHSYVVSAAIKLADELIKQLKEK